MPKQPDYDHFLVLTAAPKPNAADEYSYVFAGALPGTDDFRHVVYEEPDRVKSFHFDGVSVPPVVKQTRSGRSRLYVWRLDRLTRPAGREAKARSIAYSKAVNQVGHKGSSPVSTSSSTST